MQLDYLAGHVETHQCSSPAPNLPWLHYTRTCRRCSGVHCAQKALRPSLWSSIKTLRHKHKSLLRVSVKTWLGMGHPDCRKSTSFGSRQFQDGKIQNYEYLQAYRSRTKQSIMLKTCGTPFQASSLYLLIQARSVSYPSNSNTNTKKTKKALKHIRFKAFNSINLGRFIRL